MTEINQHQDVKDAIREAVQSGSDVHHKIKTITLKALTTRQLDMENIKNVAEEVSKGINEGLTTQSEHVKDAFVHSASALDNALAVVAETSKLAIEEAASRVNEYSQHDLNGASKDLQNLEGLFLDTLEKIAKGGNQVVADIVGDFVSHARQSGTAVGKQALTALEALKELPHWGKETVISSTVASIITLAQIGSGILLGIAESLQPSHSKKNKPGTLCCRKC
jgi:biotin carboxyl carrier protein